MCAVMLPLLLFSSFGDVSDHCMPGKGREAGRKSLPPTCSVQSVQQRRRLKPLPPLVSTSAFASGVGTNTLSCSPATSFSAAIILAVPLLGRTAAPSDVWLSLISPQVLL